MGIRLGNSSSETTDPNRIISGGAHYWNILALTLAAACILLWRLGASSLAPWDEAIYAQVSKEIANGGGWLTLHWEYQPWFEKPPLLMWVTAVLYRQFGVSEFWSRAASAFSGIGVVAVTYLIGALAFDRFIGLMAGTVLLTSYYFISYARFGTMDVMLTLFIYLAIYAYLRLNEGKPKWWYLIWTCIALAMMTKGAGGLIAPVAIFLALAFDKRLADAARSKHFWSGGLLAFVIVAPWHVAMWAWYGRAFTAEYLGYHVFARATTALEGNPSTYFYYIGKLIDGFFPWILLAPFAIFSSLKEGFKGESRSRTLLLVVAFTFGLFTIIPTRRPWYTVPIYPALAVLIAAFVVRFYERLYPSRTRRWIIVAVSILLIMTGVAYCALSIKLNDKSEDPLSSISRLAGTTSITDREPLVLFSDSEPLYAQVPLFYSNRPVRQAFVNTKPAGGDAKRYLNYEDLADIVGHTSRGVILRKDDVARLAVDYELRVLAEADPFVYASLKHKF